MPEFEHALTMRASADQVFDFVADVGNMPKYLPTTKSAQSQGPDRVRVQGEVRPPDGRGAERRYDADGYVRRLADRQRLEWGADEGYYSGWLEATDQGGGQAKVTVHISLRGTPPGADPNEAPPPDKVQEGLVAALQSIQRQLEGEGGKIEPSVTSERGADARLGG